MTKIAASIVADSICNGHRITTMKVTFPRMILAEAKTHRVMKRTDGGLEIYDIPGIGFNDDEMLSRNSASSRAIPFEKMLEAVRADPFIPIAWQVDHKGMQGSQYITDPRAIEVRRAQWLEAMDRCCSSAWALHNVYSNPDFEEEIPGVTKQLCNRLLEPFMWHTVLVTATEWENFFHLRCPQYPVHAIPLEYYRSKKDLIRSLAKFPEVQEAVQRRSELDWLMSNKGQAEIHMMALAEAMWDARNESTPKELQPGEWHIPYVDKMAFSARPELVEVLRPVVETLMSEVMGINTAIPMEVPLSTAMCAQTSYTVIGDDGKPVGGDILMDIHNSLLVRPFTNRKGVVFGPDDPKHMSPAEHCALAMYGHEYKLYIRGKCSNNSTESEDLIIAPVLAEGWCHNLNGWKSYRSMIPNESSQ